MMNTSRSHERAEDLESITDRIRDGLKSGKYTLSELQGVLVDKTKVAARTTDEYVHDNPWAVVGIAAGVGLVLGLLMGRR